MVTYGGMAKQPVIASVVSWWWGEGAAWRWPRPHSCINSGSSPVPRAVPLPSEPQHALCIHRASSFLRISNFGAFGCPSGRRTIVQVSA